MLVAESAYYVVRCGLAGLYSLIYRWCVAFLFVIGLHATEMVILWVENLQLLVG